MSKEVRDGIQVAPGDVKNDMNSVDPGNPVRAVKKWLDGRKRGLANRLNCFRDQVGVVFLFQKGKQLR